MAYFAKIRQKALEAVRNGHTKTMVNEILGLSNTTLKDWEKLLEETGSLENRPLDRKPYKINHDALRKYCEENPFATHIEAAAHFIVLKAGSVAQRRN